MATPEYDAGLSLSSAVHSCNQRVPARGFWRAAVCHFGLGLEPGLGILVLQVLEPSDKDPTSPAEISVRGIDGFGWGMGPTGHVGGDARQDWEGEANELLHGGKF